MTGEPDEAVVKIIAEQFGLDEVHADDHLIRDLGGDALDIIELVMSLEEIFNIEISDAEVDNIATVQDAIDQISKGKQVV
jgi:acyl carrier protein